MSKKRSIWKFTILAIFIVIGLVLTFASFDVAGTVYRYNGFVNAIPLGLDLSGGVSAVYEASLSSTANTSDLDSAIDSTISQLGSILYNEGFSNATIVRQGSDKIRVEIPTQENDPTSVFEVLGQPVSFYLSTNQDFDVSNPTGTYLSSKDISNLYLSYNEDGTDIGIAINFSSSASEIYNKFSSQASNSTTIYAFIGEESAISLSSSNFASANTLFVSGGVVTSSTAAEYCLRLTSGLYPASLSLSETANISPSLGQDAIMFSAIAIGVAVLAIMIVLCVRYRELGLMACVSTVIFAILFAFFLQAVPFVEMSLPGIAGVLLSVILLAAGNIIVLEKVREEYASGKKVPLSVKNAFKKSLWPILDIHIVTLISSILLYILGTTAIKSFAMVLLIGTIVAAFCTLVVSRFLIKWYLPLNSTNAKRMGLKRSKVLSEQLAYEPSSEQTLSEGGENNDEKI